MYIYATAFNLITNFIVKYKVKHTYEKRRTT